MKVLTILPTPWSMSFGGLDVQFESTIKYLKLNGVDVVCVDYFDVNLLDGVDIVHFFGFGPMYYHIGRILDGRRIPYVVSTIYYSFGKRHWLELLRGRVLSKIPETYHYLNHLFLNSAKCYLPNSNAEADQLVSVHGLDRAKVFVVPNAIDENFIGSAEKFDRSLLPSAFPDKFISSVARIVPRKNTLTLVKAAVKANTPLVLIGPKIKYGSEGSSEWKYIGEIDKIISENPSLIAYAGSLNRNTDELKNALAASHAHALISILETPGLSTLEAGLNGCNLIVGKCPPVTEYVGKISHEVDQFDIEAIASALQKSMIEDKNSRGQSEYIRSRYTWQHTAEKTIEAYKAAVYQ